MTVETTTIRNHLIMRDDANTWRWYDAFGPDAAKYVTSFNSLPCDDTTNDPTEFINTITEAGAGVSTAVVSDTAGGALLITTAADEDDGYAMQLGVANSGEWVDFSGDYPTYFGIRFQINDVDQTDCLFGVCVTDSDCLGGVTDGLYFRSIDGTDDLYIVLEKDSTESTTKVGDLTDATDITLEFYYWGHNVSVYVDGTLQATIADTDTNFPDDELLRLTMEFLTGEAVANTCTIDWVRLIQIRA